MVLTKSMIDYLLACESIQEVRGYINGLSAGRTEEPPKIEQFPYIDPISYEQPTKRKLNHRGAQANVLRALWGGTYTLEQIMKEVDLPQEVVLKTLRVLHDKGTVAELKSSKVGNPKLWQLKPEGVPKAKFFMENPHLRIYPGGRK